MWRSLVFLGVAATAFAGEVVEREVRHAGATFRVVTLEPSQLALVWKGGDGKPLATFEGVRRSVERDGRELRFIMNAGIYEPGLVPSGLHIEDGRGLLPLNLRDGRGNFFLKPNGVFSISAKGRAEVTKSARFPSISEAVRLAIQSGPILLADGKRHGAFREGSKSIKHRNGVGVNENGQVVFAMTDKRQEVNFWDFAGLFLELGCENALFLDGDISQMAVDPKGPMKSNRFAAMFVVVE